jgi:hypothetical protein
MSSIPTGADPSMGRISAIILPTPVSVISKMTVVLIVFGLYLVSIMYYTLTSEKFSFSGHTLMNFLMDRKEDVASIQQHVPRVDTNQMKRRIANTVAEANVLIPEPTPTGGEGFVGTESRMPAIMSKVQSTIEPVLRSIWSHMMTWTHVRGNTVYSRKILA